MTRWSLGHVESGGSAIASAASLERGATLGELNHSAEDKRTTLAESMTPEQLEHLNDILGHTVVHGHKVTVLDQPEKAPSKPKLMNSKTRDLTENFIANDTRDHWIDSSQATLVFAVIIFSNIFLIGVQADLPAKESNFNDSRYVFWFAVDSVFNIVFLAEIVLRLRAEGCTYWLKKVNLFDVVLVALSVIDTWVILLLSKISGSLQIISVFRTLRLLRLLRVLRLFRFSKDLWLVIHTMVRAFQALGWIMVLMVLFMYMVAVFLRLTLGVSMHEKLDGDALEVAKQRWGTVLQSMFTLFVCMTGEAWYDITLDAVEAEGWLYILFVAFMCVANFLLVNLFIGIMCEKVSVESKENEKENQRNADENTVHCLAEIFVSIDKDGSDEITIQELSEAIVSESVGKELEKLNISMPTCITSLMRFFDSGSEADGAIRFEEFVKGCMLLRNSELDVKMWFLQDEVRQMSERILASFPPQHYTSLVGQDRPTMPTIAEGGQNWMMEDFAQMLESRLREVKTGMMADFTRIMEAVVREATPATPAELHPGIAKQEGDGGYQAQPAFGHAAQGPADLDIKEPDSPVARHMGLDSVSLGETTSLPMSRTITWDDRLPQFDASHCCTELTPCTPIKEHPETMSVANEDVKATKKGCKKTKKKARQTAIATEVCAEGLATMEYEPQVSKQFSAGPEITSTRTDNAVATEPGPQITSTHVAEDAAEEVVKGPAGGVATGSLSTQECKQAQLSTEHGDTPTAAIAEQVPTDPPAQDANSPNAEQGSAAASASPWPGSGGSQCLGVNILTGAGESGPLDIELDFSSGPRQELQPAEASGLPD